MVIHSLCNRGQLDDATKVVAFTGALEELVLRRIEAGIVTKDLLCLVNPILKALQTTDSFLEAVAVALGKNLVPA